MTVSATRRPKPRHLWQRGGNRTNSPKRGGPLGDEALKRKGYAVNTILLPEQRDYVHTWAAARQISMSEAFRQIIANAMAQAPGRK